MQGDTLICGLAEEELKKIETGSIDLIITSPPYYTAVEYVHGKDRPAAAERSKRVARKPV